MELFEVLTAIVLVLDVIAIALLAWIGLQARNNGK